MKPIAALASVTAAQLLGHPLFTPATWQNFSRKAYVEPLLVEDGFHRWVLMSADDYGEVQAVGDLMEGFSDADQMTIARFLMALRDRAAREQAGENTAGQIIAGG